MIDLPDGTMTTRPPEGTRVRLTASVDRFPHFIAPKGATGTVTVDDDCIYAVKLDQPLEGAESWDNEVCFYPEDDCAPLAPLDATAEEQEAVFTEEAAAIRDRLGVAPRPDNAQGSYWSVFNRWWSSPPVEVTQCPSCEQSIPTPSES